MATLENIDGRVVVGMDTSPAAHTALDWAVDWARHRSLAITVVHVVPQVLRLVPGGGADPGLAAANSPVGAVHPVIDTAGVDEARARLEELIAPRLAGAGDLDVDIQVVSGAPAEVLVDASARAALVVVGTHGHGTIATAVLGSVSDQTITYAMGPVAVVADGAPQPSTGVLTVGVDLGEESIAALDFAVDAAAALRTPVRVVLAVDHTLPANVTDLAVLPPAHELVEAEDSALKHAVAPYAQAHPDVELTTETAVGSPATVLAEAPGSSVVVVGNRGRRAWARLLLGSTSRRLAQLNACATLVVRRPHTS